MIASRRHLVTGSAAALAFAGLARFAGAQDQPPQVSADALEADPYRSEVEGYGRLVRDPAGLFDLPQGFSYTVVSRAGEPMSDGLLTPAKMDGMGCFAVDRDRVALVRNHELKGLETRRSAFGPQGALAAKVPADRIYDRTDEGLPMAGGTTTLVYDLKARKLETHHLSLAGTSTNCAGGRTPWGSWLSCEETTQGKGMEAQKDHGWVFEVPSGLRGLADPAPITGLGRFRHEAAAIDPRTGVVYLTEDMGDGFGLFYRFLPADRRNLHAGGRLQALALPEGVDADPRNWESVYWRQGDWRAARWVDLDGVDNPYEDLRYRGHASGAAWFARGEGVYFGGGELYFACTSGGPAGGGQIFRYVPSAHEGQPGEAAVPLGPPLRLRGQGGRDQLPAHGHAQGPGLHRRPQRRPGRRRRGPERRASRGLLLARRLDPVREHLLAGHHAGDHRAVARPQGLTPVSASPPWRRPRCDRRSSGR
jgi:secreted PhoX family phosphatase